MDVVRGVNSMQTATNLQFENPIQSLTRDKTQFITLINKSAGTYPDDKFTEMSILLKFALQGKKSEMLPSISQEFEIWAKRDPHWSWMMAERYSLLDMKEKALDWFENSVDRGYINYPHLNEHSPLLENIRGEEQFKKLMKRVKYEWENFEI